MYYTSTSSAGDSGQAYKTPYSLGNLQNASIQGSGTSPSGTGSSASNSNNPEIQCAATGNPLTWVICPVILGIQSFVNGAENTINDYLTVPGQYFQTDSGSCASGSTSCTTADAIFSAWDSIRNIALALLGITALIMVISQALSFGPFDAYTVKKVLPRILIAAILITLSWSIIQLVVAASNGIGDSIRSLIYAPFASLKDTSPSSPTFLVGNLALLGGIGFLGIFGLLSFAVTALISVVTGLAIIIIRQMVVILLAIMAPVAIAAYILPGTDKIFKFWRDSLVGALLLFPIIEGVIALGGVFSKITQANTLSGNVVFNQLIAFGALVAPPFLIASFARRINGFVGTISGMATTPANPSTAASRSIVPIQRQHAWNVPVVG